MNLSNLFPSLPPAFWVRMAEIGRHRWIGFEMEKSDPDNSFVSAKLVLKNAVLPHPLGKWVEQVIYRTRDLDRYDTSHEVQTLECLGRLAADGPRIYRPTEEQAESLEHVDVRIPAGEYRQSYPMMLVQLPPGLVARLRAEYAGTDVTIPDYLGMRHWEEYGLIYILGMHVNDMQTGRVGANCMVIIHQEGKTIEDSLAKNLNLPSDDESLLMARLWRIGLNSMMLLTHYGAKSVPSNPAFLEQVRVRQKKRPLESNETEIRTHVHYMVMDQDIVVREGPPPPAREDRNGTHASPHPHWRRGHWAMVACGVGRTERRRTFRRPVFVMKDAVATVVPPPSGVVYRPAPPTSPPTLPASESGPALDPSPSP